MFISRRKRERLKKQSIRKNKRELRMMLIQIRLKNSLQSKPKTRGIGYE